MWPFFFHLVQKVSSHNSWKLLLNTVELFIFQFPAFHSSYTILEMLVAFGIQPHIMGMQSCQGQEMTGWALALFHFRMTGRVDRLTCQTSYTILCIKMFFLQCYHILSLSCPHIVVPCVCCLGLHFCGVEPSFLCSSSLSAHTYITVDESIHDFYSGHISLEG